jgi:hypothetical protein
LFLIILPIIILPKNHPAGNPIEHLFKYHSVKKIDGKMIFRQNDEKRKNIKRYLFVIYGDVSLRGYVI